MTSREIAGNCHFWKDVREHRLLSEEQLEQCLAQVPENRREPDKLDNRLARVAIHLGFLTLWQAQRVLTRRAGTLVIDKYLLTDALGQGGMGRVFLARDTRLQRQVALKVLNPDKLNHERALARFQREALVGGQLQHENLVRVYDVGMHQNSPYLVMEYIEGPTVAELIARQGRLELPVAARIGRDVALGLHHLAEKRLVHRDVNPRNILIDKEGRAKLTDLGLAIFEEQLSQVTTEGSTVGTFDYIAPEQARHSRGVDIRSDIYSLGCSLYHMISGHPPFPEGNLAEKIYSHQLREAEPLAELVPGVPQALSELVWKCLRKNPDERYRNARELADRLNGFVTDESLASTIDLNRSATTEAASASNASMVEPDGHARHASAGSQAPSASDGEADAEDSHAARRADVSLQLDLGFDSFELPRRSDPSRSATVVSPPAHSVPGGWSKVALVLIPLAAVLILVVRSMNPAGSTTGTEPPPSSNQAGPRIVPNVQGEANPEPEPATNPTSVIAVRYPDGQVRTFETIDEAARSASGLTVEIEIPHRDTPWVWTISDARPIAGSRWRIVGRGARQPLLQLDVSASKSGLLIRADSELEMESLRIEPKNANVSSPMISALGKLTLIDVRSQSPRGEAAPKTAILAETSRLTLRGCWFAGYPRTIDAKILRDSKIELERSIMMQASASPRAGAARGTSSAGSVLRLEFPNWGLEKAALSIDHSLFIGSESIRLAGTNAKPGMAMSATRSVFLGERLFAFETAFAGKAMRPNWTGSDDLFGRGLVYWPESPGGAAVTSTNLWAKFVSETRAQETENTPIPDPVESESPADFLGRFEFTDEFGPLAPADDR